MVAAADTEAADLDQPGKVRRRAHREAAAPISQIYPVIAYQHRRRKLPGTARQDQIERQPGFSRTGRTTDQDAEIADPHRRSVDAGCRTVCDRGHVGNRTTKRAPATVAIPSASDGPGRFSAQMRPRCASMICFEIDRPNPEFWPKP